MPREKEAYRDNLSRILEAFPGREIITITELCAMAAFRPKDSETEIPDKKRDWAFPLRLWRGSCRREA